MTSAIITTTMFNINAATKYLILNTNKQTDRQRGSAKNNQNCLRSGALNGLCMKWWSDIYDVCANNEQQCGAEMLT